MKKWVWVICIILMAGNVLAQGQKTETLKLEWTGTEWQNLMRTDISYPAGDQRIETSHNWNGSDWVPSVRLSYTFDGHSNPIILLMEMYMGDSWMLLSTNTMDYTYDGDNITVAVYQTNGINSDRELYTYSGGHLSQLLMQSWNGTGWDDFFRNTYTYTGDNLTEVISEEWTGSVWQNNIKTTYFYSGSQQTGYEGQEWIDGSWVNFTKNIYTYDGPNISEELIQEWTGSSWADYQKMLHTYGPVSINDVSINIIEDFGLSNYPNPFNPHTNITFELPNTQRVSLVIYDMSGRVVKELIHNDVRSAGPHQEVWNGYDRLNNPAPSGIYFYQLKAGANIITKRCVLLK